MLTNHVVLYSHRDQAWKIADFGLATEGTSGRALTTHYSRGTCSYRAPELVEYDKRTYTNKVDIWAIGCILYELVLGKKAFSTDHAVYVYTRQFTSSGGTLDKVLLDFETLPDDSRKSFLSSVIHEMLEVDAKNRPRAEELYTKFTCWGGVAPSQRVVSASDLSSVSSDVLAKMGVSSVGTLLLFVEISDLWQVPRMRTRNTSRFWIMRSSNQKL
jgi:serine/threonine protein kinase